MKYFSYFNPSLFKFFRMKLYFLVILIGFSAASEMIDTTSRSDCPMQDTAVNGRWFDRSDTETWMECGLRCFNDPDSYCKSWDWSLERESYEKNCYLYINVFNTYERKGFTSGEKDCFEKYFT